ncbi:MAG: MFS transporter [Oscillospiraceae bacterium]|nr:MFS transporter [Oscillospiraceae bacterium]
MKRKASKFWLALVIFSLTGQVAWVVENMYFNVFIYKMFHADAAAISAMVAASAVAATLTTIFIGALSDKVGKRKLFICGGYILWGISIGCFALIRTDLLSAVIPATVSAASVGVALTIIMDCVMTFFGSTANDACFNAWLTDSTDQSNRGAAEGINAMMPLLAILVVFGGFMAFDLNLQESWTLIFIIIGAAVLLIGILGMFLIRDSAVRTEETSHYFRNIFYGFRPSVLRENRLLYLSLAAFAVFNISIQIFMPYLILYYNVSLKLDNYVLIMAPAVLLASLVTAFYGRLYDRCGFRTAVVPSMLLLMAGYVLLYCFRNTALVFVGSLLMMCGYLTGMAVFGAMLRDRTPIHRAGMFQGLRIVCQVLIPGVIGPAIGARVLRNAETVLNNDGTTSFVPNENIFLAALLAAALVWVVLIFVFRRIRKEAAHA